MARTTYRNGDEITLQGCNGCSPSRINGVLCHEHGCPDAWRDYPVDCFECGCEFLRTEGPRQQVCQDCLEPMGLDGEPDFGDEDDEAHGRECEACGDEMDRDCNGNPRCPTCDGPCPCCDDGAGPGADGDETDETA